jgi:hypothetical protein
MQPNDSKSVAAPVVEWPALVRCRVRHVKLGATCPHRTTTDMQLRLGGPDICDSYPSKIVLSQIATVRYRRMGKELIG